MTIRYAILGAGGFGIEVAGYLRDLYRDQRIEINFWDDRCRDDIGAAGFNYFGPIRSFQAQMDEEIIICVGSCTERANIAALVREKHYHLSSFVHPMAAVSSRATISPGCVILPFANVSFDAYIGINVAINSHSAIGHHAKIGDHSVISPQCLVSGGAVLGSEVFLGASSVITPGKALGDGCKVAAGSIVYRDAPQRSFLSGNPAKNLRKVDEKFVHAT